MSVFEVSDLFDPHFTHTGCTAVSSPLGEKALQFDNTNLDFASQYVTSDVLLPQGDFSVQFYLRTYASGCNGIPLPEGTLKKGEDPLKMTEELVKKYRIAKS